MTTAAPNQYEAAAREKKAAALARAYWDLALATIETFSDEQWQHLAMRIGKDDASEETRKLVMQILRSMRPVQDWKP